MVEGPATADPPLCRAARASAMSDVAREGWGSARIIGVSCGVRPGSVAAVTPADLAAVISDGVHTAIQSGRISAEVPKEIRVERPRHRSHGDYSTNVAMQL